MEMSFTTHATPTNMASEHFLSLEDLHCATPPFDDDNNNATTAPPSIMQVSPPPVVIVHSKPAKKRKSWGQELPEAKTILPPRKRAKTEDEKEQRRIERIKRNRAAAHNSRERKRQETDTLAVALARANAELDAYRRLHGPLPPSVVLPEVTLSHDDPDTPAPSLIDSSSAADPPSPHSPADDIFHLDPHVKQETFDSTDPYLFAPAFTHHLDLKPSPFLSLDPTQHSAAMLCDLQCRSSGNKNHNNKTSMATAPSPITSTPSYPASWWRTLILYVMTIQLRLCMQTLLTAMWTLAPSRMARWMQASTRRLTSPSTTSSMTLLLSRSTRVLAQRNAATDLVVARHGAAVAALKRRSAERARLAERASEGQERAPVGCDEAGREQREVDNGKEVARDDGGV